MLPLKLSIKKDKC